MPAMPVETAYLWRWWCDLSRARTMGWSAPDPMSWGDCEAYLRLISVRPARWEVEALRLLDDAFLESRMSKSVKTVKGAKALTNRVPRKDG